MVEYGELVDTLTIYQTVTQYDTIMEFEYDMVEVDCETGYPCTELPWDCPIYIPNSFTPDNDGVNDVWGAVTDASCWLEWELGVYSRSGAPLWVSNDPDAIWLGGDVYYVPSDVYVYRLVCTGFGVSYAINGHVTVVR